MLDDALAAVAHLFQACIALGFYSIVRDVKRERGLSTAAPGGGLVVAIFATIATEASTGSAADNMAFWLTFFGLPYVLGLMANTPNGEVDRDMDAT